MQLLHSFYNINGWFAFISRVWVDLLCLGLIRVLHSVEKQIPTNVCHCFNTLTIDEPATIGAVALVQLGQKRLDNVTVSLFALHF